MLTGWKLNLAFIWLGVFISLLGANFVFPFLPFYIEELGVEDEGEIAVWTGLLGSVTGLSLTLTAPLWGGLADRLGRKPMFVRALIGAGVMIALMGVAQEVWHLLVLRFVMGMFAGTMGAAAALVAATIPRREVTRALGILQTAIFSANMMGPLLGGVSATAFGLRGSFFACAVLYGIGTITVLIFVRERRSDTVVLATSEGEPGPPAGRPKPTGGIIQNLRDVLKERQVLFILGVLFALWLGTTFVRPILPLAIDSFSNGEGDSARIHESLGFASWELTREAATGLTFGVLGATSTIAALAVGGLGVRFGLKRVVAGTAALSGLLYLTVAASTSFSLFIIALGAVGLFQGAMVPGTNGLIAGNTPEGKEGSAFGLAASMQSLALLVGPLAGGFTAAIAGIRAPYVVLTAVLLAAAFVTTTFVNEPNFDSDA